MPTTLTIPPFPKLPEPTDAVPFPVLSFSMIDEFLRCERRFFFKYLLRYDLGLRQTALEFGDSWHKGVRVWYDTRDVGKAKEAFSIAWGGDPKAVGLDGKRTDFGHGGDSQDDDLRTEAMAHKRLEEYAQRYDREPFKVLAQEVRLAIPIGSFWYQVVIDRIIEWEDGILYVKESKSTTRLGAMFFKRFDPDYQTRGYVVAAAELLDPRISNAYIDAMWLGKTRPKEGDMFARDFVSVPEWKKREFENAVLTLGSDINKKARAWREIYADMQTDHTPQEIAAWAVEPDPQIFVPDFSACTDFGECPYRGLCITEPAARLGRLRTDYKKREERKREVEA